LGAEPQATLALNASSTSECEAHLALATSNLHPKMNKNKLRQFTKVYEVI